MEVEANAARIAALERGEGVLRTGLDAARGERDALREAAAGAGEVAAADRGALAHALAAALEREPWRERDEAAAAREHAAAHAEALEREQDAQREAAAAAAARAAAAEARVAAARCRPGCLAWPWVVCRWYAGGIQVVWSAKCGGMQVVCKWYGLPNAVVCR